MRAAPILLCLPEGLSISAEQEFKDRIGNAAKALGLTVLLLPHGTMQPMQRVEHHPSPQLDDALLALPRIAEAMEQLVKEMQLLRNNHYGHPNTGPR